MSSIQYFFPVTGIIVLGGNYLFTVWWKVSKMPHPSTRLHLTKKCSTKWSCRSQLESTVPKSHPKQVSKILRFRFEYHENVIRCPVRFCHRCIRACYDTDGQICQFREFFSAELLLCGGFLVASIIASRIILQCFFDILVAFGQYPFHIWYTYWSVIDGVTFTMITGVDKASKHI